MAATGTPRRPSSTAVDGGLAARRADLASIHCGAKALGWDEDQYRDLLWQVCQVRSAGDLDAAGRKRFLDHMRACGWSGSASRRPARKRVPWSRQQSKAWSLWQQLADAGLVRQRSLQALEAWVRRHGPTEVAAFQWLQDKQLDLVIEMLKQWLKRAEDHRAA